MESEYVFLKLGGSLITDKTHPKAPRLPVIQRIANEIASAIRDRPGMRLLLGHGSGSFGHDAASRHGTAQGVRTATDWLGFSEVWKAADALDRMMIDALSEAGVSVIRISPSATMTATAGALQPFSCTTLHSIWNAGLVPVVYGDVVFDSAQGGAIASTESIFSVAAKEVNPKRILLAGIERGVYSDFPVGHSVIPFMSASDPKPMNYAIQGSAHTDVTGGMHSKVLAMRALLLQGLVSEVLIFSGEEDGNVRKAIVDEPLTGTRMIK
jgi:isopentenyl phosphate kinase